MRKCIECLRPFNTSTHLFRHIFMLPYSYYRAKSGDCHPCSWCCADSKEGDKEEQCIEQTNLPVNQVCRYDVNTIKCAPSKDNSTSHDPATSAVPNQAGAEGDVAYGMGSKKESNIILVIAISGFVALGICILIGLLYICNRKNDRPSHLTWATILCVNRHRKYLYQFTVFIAL